MRHALFHADRGESTLRSRDALFRENACIDQRQLDVVKSGDASEQIERLEDEADLFVSDARQFVVIEFADKLVVQPVIPLRR